MIAPACSRCRTIGASSRAMTCARPATPFGVRWPRTSTLSLMVIGTPQSGPIASPWMRRASSRSAAAIAASPRSSVTAFRRGLTARIRSTAATATSRHDTSPAVVAATISVAVHCQSGRSVTGAHASWTPVWPAGSDAGDAVDLDQRVARDAAGGGDRRAHARLGAEAAEEDLVHAGVVLQVVQVDVDLEDLLHRGAHRLELLLHLVEHVLRVRLDVALEVRADAGDEDQVAVLDRPAEERRLLGLLAVVPEHLLHRRGR